MAVSQVSRIVRVTFRYDLYRGDSIEEESQHSLVYRASEVPSLAADIDATLNDMANAALASQKANVPTDHFPNSVRCSSVRVALEGIDGKTLAEQIVAASGALAWQGTAGNSSLPWSSSMAVSVYAYQPGTFAPLGKSQRGRFYLPPLATNAIFNDGSGEIVGDTATAIADGWGQVCQEIQQHTYSLFPAFLPVLGINSRRQVAFYPATYIRFDNKLDTQRRRLKSENAVVGSAPYPHP